MTTIFSRFDWVHCWASPKQYGTSANGAAQAKTTKSPVRTFKPTEVASELRNPVSTIVEHVPCSACQLGLLQIKKSGPMHDPKQWIASTIRLIN